MVSSKVKKLELRDIFSLLYPTMKNTHFVTQANRRWLYIGKQDNSRIPKAEVLVYILCNKTINNDKNNFSLCGWILRSRLQSNYWIREEITIWSPSKTWGQKVKQ